jgi:hypothetical protein
MAQPVSAEVTKKSALDDNTIHVACSAAQLNSYVMMFGVSA